MKTFVTRMLAAGLFGTALLAHAADGPAPTYLPFNAANGFQNAPSIVEGASGSAVKTTIYVFMDPNCIYCHLAWKALQPYEAVGLQVHWIPMGFLKPDSPGKAAALLVSKDGAALLKTLETNYSEQDESGGIAPLATIPDAVKAQLDANAQLFQSLGLSGTPTIIYRASGGRWADIDGLPKLAALAQMLNLPAQPTTDPELQKYQ
ncbi:thioredoxin fold domain-containing protein [Pararobbsia silviterrae]|uniref:Disulfide isomerase n=1 Tax=Pararobbsia silviterrae TaxID=1792498 RepID=A0A494YEA5_9BURK|nr:thioredoxin fold domain-containing protein [Pararobbsia silviterrae]RKP58683.1 disulfide isomerase [Pararobbsia silviterrae]